MNRVTHDRVFIQGQYVPVKARTAQMMLDAMREGTLRVHDQPTSGGYDRRIWRRGYKCYYYVGIVPRPQRPTPRDAMSDDLEAQRRIDDARYGPLDAGKDLKTEGWVYAMTCGSFPGWVKIGHSSDPERRLFGYQTSSPFRDYRLLYWGFFCDRKAAEAIIHEKVAPFATERRGEWFKLKRSIAAEAIASIMRQ